MAKTKDPTERFYATLNDGRTLCFFVNKQTNLVVVDAVEKDEFGGNEFVRTRVPPPFTPAQRERLLAMPDLVD